MMLEVDLTHAFDDFSLDVEFSAPPGITAVFGHSGAGKTSIINMIAGLIHPKTGRVKLGDRLLTDTEKQKFVPAHKRRIGYVFQDGRLFPHLNVARNMRFGARFAYGPALVPETELVALLGLAPLMQRLPGELSGGERQRVALARALLTAPEVLLMDEPLAAIDGPRKDEVLPYLEELRDRTRLPILYVSHSVGEIARLADQVVILENGRKAMSGATSDLLRNPAALPFFGVREASSILQARVDAHDEDGLTQLSISGARLLLPSVPASVGESIVIRILAHDILISVERPIGLSSRNILPVTVDDIHKGDGPGVAVSLRLGNQLLLSRITARAANELALHPGLTCYAIVKATTVSRRNIGRLASGRPC